MDQGKNSPGKRGAGKTILSEDFLESALEKLDLPRRKKLAGMIVSLVFGERAFE